MDRRRLEVVFLCAAMLVCAAVADAQTVRGRVVDGNTNAGIAEAVIAAETGERTATTVVSDSSGNFTLNVPAEGVFTIRARASGHSPSNPIQVQLRRGATIDVQLTMQREVVFLDPLTIRGRGGRIAPSATVEGLYARRAALPRVGTSRVFVRGDPELNGVSTVAGLLDRWLQLSRTAQTRCVDWFVNGQPLHPMMEPGEFVRGMATSALEGVEYYRDDTSAPLDLRGRGWCHFRTGGFHSIIAIWYRV